ncbi:MAG: dihydroorotate dehydrogenase [Candidatus Margulisbacteria bacterium]|nr:dihydroorotate dehydrogenase [Candidatus Margulisiibacteriota bacterium]
MVNLDKKRVSPVKIGSVTYPNPIWLASGTVAFGAELSEILDLNMLGGIVLKGTTLEPREGNPPPRLVETPSGLLNAIGLQNPGVEGLIKDKLPFLKQFKVPVILNIAGKHEDEYVSIVQRVAEEAEVQGYELNLSCPNVENGLDLGTDPQWVESVVKKVKKVAGNVPVLAKITPNVTRITDLSKAAENGGADAISLINTLVGMAFNTHTQQPILANKIGGLSGPAIRPVAIRMVYQVRQTTSLPIVGMGGIMNQHDVDEFYIAGADCVQLGTLNFVDIHQLRSLINTAQS